MLDPWGMEEIPTGYNELTMGVGEVVMKWYTLECKCLKNESRAQNDWRSKFAQYADAKFAGFSVAKGNKEKNEKGNVYKIEIPDPTVGDNGVVYVENVDDNVHGGKGLRFKTMKGHFESGSISFTVQKTGDTTTFMIMSVARTTTITSYAKWVLGGGIADEQTRNLYKRRGMDISKLGPKNNKRGAGYWLQSESWIAMLKNIEKDLCKDKGSYALGDHWFSEKILNTSENIIKLNNFPDKGLPK